MQVEFTDTPVRAVKRSFLCPKCHGKNIAFSGGVLTSCPPQYEHVCHDCGMRVALPAQNGQIMFVEDTSPGVGKTYDVQAERADNIHA